MTTNAISTHRRFALGAAAVLLAACFSAVAPAATPSAEAADVCTSDGLQFSTKTEAYNVTCANVQARHVRYYGGIHYFDSAWSSSKAVASSTLGTEAGGYYRSDTGTATTNWKSI